MPNLKVMNMNGREVGEISLSDEIFGAEVNPAALHTAVKVYLANRRQGTQSTLTRTEVSGGGRKPWRQKGTGRARQGSTRSPQWIHGGIALGPKPRSYRMSLNKKERRQAMFGALSSKVSGGDFIMVDAIKTDDYKTKTMVGMLASLGAAGKALIVLDTPDKKVIASCANIPGVKTTQYNTLNAYDILNCGKLIMAQPAAKLIEEVYAK